MKLKVKNLWEKIIKYIKNYIKNNPLFTSYILLSIIEVLYLRLITTHTFFHLNPLLTDLGLIIFLGSFNFFFKTEKGRYHYLQTLIILYTIVTISNTIYYSCYASFGSITELSSLGQANKVTGAIWERFSILYLLYLFIPILFYIIYNKMKKKSSILNNNKIYIKNKIKKTILTSILILVLSFITATGQDYSRLYKQWNRPYVVNRFGIILYQSIDVFKYLTTNISSVFGFQNALIDTTEYYENNDDYQEANKYTGLLEGYNIVFVHMESVQSFLLDLNFNNQDVLPNVKKLIKEGMYFSNFYPQISLGTSSDTEFTILTSLLPTNTGIVFTNYYNRDYTTIPKIFNDKNYYTFSMHGNDFTMWNRSIVHPTLGYKHFYFKDSYTFTEDESLNLGINDSAFFKQSITYLEDIEKTTTNYMGTVITLSNHSPFIYLDKYAPYDLSKTYRIYNAETNKYESEKIDYLTGTTIGNYIISSHNADIALGEFIDSINDSNYFNNTIFIFYGDHDPRLSIDQYNYFYNYDPLTNDILNENDEQYYDYNEYSQILNRSTPLIIWSKNEKVRDLLHGEYDYPMGMIDVMPTIGNMFNFKNDYALGHDIFNIKNNNIVVFPNGDYITKNFLYNSSNNNIYTLKDNISIKDQYLEETKEYANKIISISNNIIKYDLLKIIKENR